MEVVLGIGDMGCAIVDNFKKQEEFEVYKINKKTRGNRSLSLKEQDNLEQYEKLAMQKADKIKEMFEDVEESDCVTVFVSGADKISGATLVVLESLKLQTDNIEVVCISPDKEFLNEVNIQSENGFTLGLEMTIKAKLHGYKIGEIPTIWIDRSFGESKFNFRKFLPSYIHWALKLIFRSK